MDQPNLLPLKQSQSQPQLQSQIQPQPLSSSLASNQTEFNYSNSIEIRKLVNPLSRCILIVVLLYTSTGWLVRQLIVTALTDLIVFVVGLIWLLGDIIPCVSIMVVIHDSLIDRNNKNQNSPILNLIIVVFGLLYLVDGILFITCYFNLHKTGKICISTLQNFRQTFFHIQVVVSIIYLSKFWQWTQPDIRNIIKRFERYNLLFYRIAHSISSRLGSHKETSTSQKVAEGVESTSNLKNLESSAIKKNPIRKRSSKTAQSKTKRVRKTLSSLSSTRSTSKRAVRLAVKAREGSRAKVAKVVDLLFLKCKSLTVQ